MIKFIFACDKVIYFQWVILYNIFIDWLISSQLEKILEIENGKVGKLLLCNGR